MMPIVLDLPSLAAVLSLSESTIQKLTRESKDFPKPRQLSGRRVGWLSKEVQDWAESRPISEQLPPHNTMAKKPRPPQTPLNFG